MTAVSLVDVLPAEPDPDALLDGFVDFVAGQGIELYPAQEEAILELLDGNHVILNTPTGSGKSLVAAAAHFAALAQDRRSVYTAPIKALVSEKFFALCRRDVRDRQLVGHGHRRRQRSTLMRRSSVARPRSSPTRPSATAENTDADVVIMDEFHFYGDPQRGWAWQVPLLDAARRAVPADERPRWVNTGPFLHEDSDDTAPGRPSVEVTQRPAARPARLRLPDHARCTTSVSRSCSTREPSPIYIVHFTQADDATVGGAVVHQPRSTRCRRRRRRLVKEAVGGFRFDSVRWART